MKLLPKKINIYIYYYFNLPLVNNKIIYYKKIFIGFNNKLYSNHYIYIKKDIY